MDTEQIKSPIKAIRAKCFDCCNGQANEVKRCPVTTCALHPFRLGKNPFSVRRSMSEEQRKAVAERFAIARENKKIGEAV